MHHEAAKKTLAEFLWVLPLQKQLFFSTPGSSPSFAKIAEYAEMTICFTEATRLLENYYENCGICGSLISFTPPL